MERDIFEARVELLSFETREDLSESVIVRNAQEVGIMILKRLAT